jgi:hypothetical protein
MRSIPAMCRLARALGALLLALLSGGAAADWTPVRSDGDIYSAYADQASIRPRGANVSMSGLYDFRRRDFTPDGKGLFSTVVLREYDCAGRRVRLLSAISFAEHMGAGEAVSTSAETGRWESIVDGALDEAYWKIACAGK